MKTKTSLIIKIIISTLLAFYEMSKFLFYKYGDMTLAGKHYNSGIEAGVSDAFMWFILAVVLGVVIWLASMFVMTTVERLINKRSNEKRRAEKEEEGDVFHD